MANRRGAPSSCDRGLHSDPHVMHGHDHCVSRPMTVLGGVKVIRPWAVHLDPGLGPSSQPVRRCYSEEALTPSRRLWMTCGNARAKGTVQELSCCPSSARAASAQRS